MPQYVCAVNKDHTKYFALPVEETLRCCGRPMLMQGAPPLAAAVAQPPSRAVAEPQAGRRNWWKFWD